MKQMVLSIVLIVSFFITACELKDAETETEKCQKKQRELVIPGIAQCAFVYTPGSDDYNLCVDLVLISLIDNYEMCKK
jgi:hypothetical protein